MDSTPGVLAGVVDLFRRRVCALEQAASGGYVLTYR
jgi:hypothetical protein